jgi:hypothetical protein
MFGTFAGTFAIFPSTLVMFASIFGILACISASIFGIFASIFASNYPIHQTSTAQTLGDGLISTIIIIVPFAENPPSVPVPSRTCPARFSWQAPRRAAWVSLALRQVSTVRSLSWRRTSSAIYHTSVSQQPVKGESAEAMH